MLSTDTSRDQAKYPVIYDSVWLFLAHHGPKSSLLDCNEIYFQHSFFMPIFKRRACKVSLAFLCHFNRFYLLILLQIASIPDFASGRNIQDCKNM